MEHATSELAASAPRRIVALAILLLLGGLLFYVALAFPPSSFVWQGFLLVFGGLTLVLASRFYQSTRLTVTLKDGVLSDSSGQHLCAIDQIERVERGIFAFKPSNGFLLILNEKGSRHWAPGLWWRLGCRIGIGGVVSASQAKFMAEALSFAVAQRHSRSNTNP